MNDINMKNIMKHVDLCPTNKMKEKKIRAKADNSKPTWVLPLRGSRLVPTALQSSLSEY